MHGSIEHVLTPRLVKSYLDRVTSPELEKIGITPSSAAFLMKIGHNEGISLKGLSEMMLVDKAHTTRMANKLIQDGLVENVAEGHQYSLVLTEKGKDLSHRAWKVTDDALQGLYGSLTPEERETMHVIMEKIFKVISED
ncbi:MAG: MarR family transcriptional regulator [Thermoplasmata archaeon]|nr:MarR family transcriptional regulator [Thermoplasmata archaeon]